MQSPAAGQSTFIVGVNPKSGIYQIAAFETAPQPGHDVFVVNGAAFSGRGWATPAARLTTSIALKPGS